MITPGALLPRNSIQDIKPIQTPPQTGLGTEFAASAELGFRHNLLSDEILRARKLLDPSHAEQMVENAAKREEYLNDEINNMKSGIVPFSVGFLGNILGFAADPNNLLTEFGASALMGPGRAIIARALAQSSKGARVGAEAAMGAAQQGLAFTPAALADYDVSQQLGQHPTALSVMANIGLAAGFGAVFHGLKANKAITTEAHDTALQTATAQTMNDQRVDVGDIVKQGYNEARENEKPLNTPDKSQEIGEQVRGAQEKTGVAEKALNEAKESQSFKNKVKGLIEEPKTASHSELIDRALKIGEAPAATRSIDDNLFLKSLPKNEEFQRALEITKKPEEQRTTDEHAFMKSFNNGDESLMIKNRLEEQRKQITDLQQQIREEKPESAAAEGMKTKIADLDERMKAGEDRLDELAGHGNESPSVKAARKEFEAAKAESEQLKNVADAHDMELQMQRTPKLDVNPSDVEATIKKQGDWRNDTSLNPEDIAAFDKQAEAVPANEQMLADAEAAIADLQKAGALTEEDNRILDELKQYEESSNRYEAALKALKDCLIGRGE